MIRERDWERRGLLNQVSNEKPPVKNHDWSKCFKNTYLFHTNSFDKTKDSPYYTPKVATLSIPFIHCSKTFLGDPGAVSGARKSWNEARWDWWDHLSSPNFFSSPVLLIFVDPATRRPWGWEINSDMRSTRGSHFRLFLVYESFGCVTSLFSPRQARFINRGTTKTTKRFLCIRKALLNVPWHIFDGLLWVQTTS